ncbi:TolC family protein [Tunicatimonas pelagia]|uniref:TolC family protein n=1 Tax=Tunicatimonas pelagia TaxID=931531 RepID=UPI002666DA11|nr:TolC family protein [Tunicatimonas pelagia]WKN45425.1 TolC family protein [Tunicatimonas pelagia]
MFRYLFCLIIFWGIALATLAQSDTTVQVRSTLSLEDFFQTVLVNHPVARQAYLLQPLAQQELRLARGSFDPTLSSNFSTKEYGGSPYYEIWNTQLDIPMWFPADLSIGYEQNRGQFINNEESNTEDGLISAGVSMPIGRGLFIDERRAAVRIAQQMQEMAEADQVNAINQVLLDAGEAYWDWYYAHQAYEVTNEVAQLAEVRLRGVVQQVKKGDAAPFDSLTAYINYQEREVQRDQARLADENARLTASVFVWQHQQDGFIPQDIRESTQPIRPDSLFMLSLNQLAELQQQARTQHPDLIVLAGENQQLRITERLNKEYLKPTVDLTYNFLAQSVWGNAPSLLSNGRFSEPAWWRNNYTAEIAFAFPLFLRQERAALAQTRLQLKQNTFEQGWVQRTIENEVTMAYNTLFNLRGVIGRQQKMVANYEQLLAGEQRRFRFGESSLFLINTRETELLDARIELLDLQTQYEKARLNLQYAAGVPNLAYETSTSDQDVP